METIPRPIGTSMTIADLVFCSFMALGQDGRTALEFAKDPGGAITADLQLTGFASFWSKDVQGFTALQSRFGT